MLTDTAIQKARPKAKRYKLADAFGLYLAVMPSGKKVFRYEYRYHGRRETLTIGTYSPDKDTGFFTLLKAREEHAKARAKLEGGRSPSQQKRGQKLQDALKIKNTFQAAGEAWLTEFALHRSPEWARHVRRWFENDVFPVIGAMPLSEIHREDVLKACGRALGRGSAYTADSIRRHIAAVFDQAIRRGLPVANPARAARGDIQVPPTRDMPVLSPKQIRELVTAVRAGGGRPSTRIAMELLLLTFTRKSELLRARWDEFDLDAAEWRIPAERMKMREAHVVPLSAQAVKLLKKQQPLAGESPFVFPGLNLFKPLSDTVLNNGLRRLGYEDFSPHGFRRTASTTLNELGWRPDIIERQLAHKERNKVRAAYNKATYLPERTKMMQAWADHVAAILAGAKVVPIKAKAANAK